MNNANELRIGNLVANLHDVCRVNVIYLSHFTVYNPNDIELNSAQYALRGIPLTPKILEACGFKKHDNSNEYFTFWELPNGWHIAESHHNEPSAGVKKGLFYWGENYLEIKHLHQLQNLYFALTGQELAVADLAGKPATT